MVVVASAVLLAKKDESFVGGRDFEWEARDVVAIAPDRGVAVERDPLIGNHPARFVGYIRADRVGVKRGLGSGDKKPPGLMQGIQSLKIQIAPIYNVSHSRARTLTDRAPWGSWILPPETPTKAGIAPRRFGRV
jgi:hypothetical protein